MVCAGLSVPIARIRPGVAVADAVEAAVSLAFPFRSGLRMRARKAGLQTAARHGAGDIFLVVRFAYPRVRYLVVTWRARGWPGGPGTTRAGRERVDVDKSGRVSCQAVSVLAALGTPAAGGQRPECHPGRSAPGPLHPARLPPGLPRVRCARGRRQGVSEWLGDGEGGLLVGGDVLGDGGVVGWLCATSSMIEVPLATAVPGFGLMPTTVPGGVPLLAGT